MYFLSLEVGKNSRFLGIWKGLHVAVWLPGMPLPALERP